MNILRVSLIFIIFAIANCSEHRIRRQSDSTTEVVGLVMERDATKGEYETLKRAAVRVSRERVRGKRAIFSLLPDTINNAAGVLGLPPVVPNNHVENALNSIRNVTSTVTNTFTTLVTAVQKIFFPINHNITLANSLVNSVEVQRNPILRRMVVVNEDGVRCKDVCKSTGNGFATIGIWLKCAKPSDTVLCSDDAIE
ncbi:unnamed protein product [Allacma fusca]|uniref:Uncharacterized protein n=1 Tax=Allacma fusca TaxID=39272 RepID=A0A8J2L6D4_9HEXA|nr:unnamed protein product [Allacma fusca]